MGTPTAVDRRERRLSDSRRCHPGEYTVKFELAGFGTVIREGIRVGVGFTATVNTELNVASVAESVTVSGQSPVVDVTNTTVATRYDTETARQPAGRPRLLGGAGADAGRRRWAASTSAAAARSPSSRTRPTGLTSAGGVNRAEVEGVMVNEGGGGGGSDMYYTDYGAFAEIAINAVGNGAEMPSPGVLSQLIAKSGGNQYHGNVYFDYQNDSMEATNIDDAQIAAGVRRQRRRSIARDTNRLEQVSGLQRRPRRVRQEGPPVVVRRVPADRHRSALSDAARRHPGHVRCRSAPRKVDLQRRPATTS